MNTGEGPPQVSPAAHRALLDYFCAWDEWWEREGKAEHLAKVEAERAAAWAAKPWWSRIFGKGPQA